jgi:hypothetical protein
VDEHQQKWNQQTAQHIIKNLKKRRMEGSYAAEAAQAVDEVAAMIPDGASVFRCGSMSTVYAGLWDKLKARPEVELIDPYQPGIAMEEGLAIRRQGLSADFMIASSNAITLDGQLVNLDGMGNRVAAMTFGPAKVILLVGMNKVAPNLQCALDRVKHYAAPVNAMRLGTDTPCAKTGLCADCRSPQRLCQIWSVIEGQMIEGRIHVKLVGENLGY